MYRLTPEILRFHPIPYLLFPYSPFKYKKNGLNMSVAYSTVLWVSVQYYKEMHKKL